MKICIRVSLTLLFFLMAIDVVVAQEQSTTTATTAHAPRARAAMARPSDSELLPPNARPGECYARAFIPPQYKTTEEKLVKQEAGEELSVTPAEFETVEEKVVVEEASHTLEIIPPTYEWVEEKVMVRPEHKKIEIVPAQYEVVENKVMDKPAHTVWKRGRGPIEKIDNATGEIMCLVEVPATYKVVKKRILKAPASTKETVIPAEFKTVRKKVVKIPAQTQKVEVPAKYETITVERLVTAPSIDRQPIAEEFQTVSKTVKVADGRMEWRSVLCETNMNDGSIAAIQQALIEAGFDPGAADGKMGSKTVSAIRQYQKKHGLAEGGFTLETLEKLGVKTKQG